MDKNLTSFKSEENTIFKNYVEKIQNKIVLNGVDSDDINNLIILLNWCFNKKNGFFVPNFNKKMLFSILKTYNQLKTNILHSDSDNLFYEISNENLKTLKFIIYQYTLQYDNLCQDNDLNKLCTIVNKQSMKKILLFVGSYIN